MNNIINNDQDYYNSASNIESSTIKSELIIDEGIKQEYNEDTTADSYSINNDEGTSEYDYLQSDEQWVDEKTYLQRFLKSEVTIKEETKEYNEGITKIAQEVKYDHHADIDNSIKVKKELQDDEYYLQRFMESEIKIEEYSSDIKEENQAENKFMDNKKTLIKPELLDDVQEEYDEDETNEQEEDDIPVARFMKSEVTIEDEIQESKIAPNISSTMDIKKRFKCNTCDRVFAQLNGLKIHIRSHTGEKPFQCNECFKSFATSSYLTVHKRFHTGEKPYKCKICEKVFYDHSSLKRHFNFHIAEKIYKCTICGKAFSHQAKLETHCRVHSGEKPFKCTICFKTFGNDEWFKKHTRSHIKETVCLCTMCGIFIKSRSKLKQHERTHTGTKDHKCSYCDKEFLRKSALINHMRTHTGERPYECTTCQSKFRTHSALITHTNVIHKKIKTNKRR